MRNNFPTREGWTCLLVDPRLASRHRRMLVIVLGAVIALALSGIGIQSAAASTRSRLAVSLSPDRSNAVRLDGLTVKGKIYIFVRNSKSLDKVDFYLDSRRRTKGLNPRCRADRTCAARRLLGRRGLRARVKENAGRSGRHATMGPLRLLPRPKVNAASPESDEMLDDAQYEDSAEDIAAALVDDEQLPVGQQALRVIALANQKGGVAKTTTSTLNLGVALEELGHRVLTVDMDPQGNLTMSQGLNPDDIHPSDVRTCSSRAWTSRT